MEMTQETVLSLKRIRELLAPMNLRAVAKQTGLHHNTIRAVANGKETLSYQTVKILSVYFTKREETNGQPNTVSS